MSQSNESDPNKTKKPGTSGEAEPFSERPSADTTEEVVSAVNAFFGINRDPSKTGPAKRGESSTKDITTKATSDKSEIHQADPNTQSDSETRRLPDTSKASDLKVTQSSIGSRNARDSNSGRIMTKSNSERQVESKQQGSERPSLDPTESVVSALTQFFGIGAQSDKISQAKLVTPFRNEQIVATSQSVVKDDDTVTREQKSESKVPDSKIPSTVTAKQKYTPETSTKGDKVTSHLDVHQSTNNQYPQQPDDDVEREQTLSSLTGSARPSKDPTESVVSALTKFFGIGAVSDKAVPANEVTGHDETNDTARNHVEIADGSVETRKQTSDTKVPDKEVPSTIYSQQNVTPQSNAVPSSIRKQSQSPISVGRNSRRLTETGETSSKRVTIVPPANTKDTPSESVVSAVTDVFGISISAHSIPQSNTDVTPLLTSSSQKQIVETRSSKKDLDKRDDTNVASEMRVTPDTAKKPQPDNDAVPGNKEETARMINNNEATSSTLAPVATKAADSIATPSQTTAPLDVNSKGAQSAQPVTNKTETQQPMNDQRWLDTVSTQNSNEPRSQADFSTSTPVIVGKQDSKKVTSSAAESKVTSSPERVAAPIPVVVAPQDHKDKQKSPSHMAQPIEKKELESPRKYQQPKTESETESKPSDIKGSPIPEASKAANSEKLPTPAPNTKDRQSVAESKVESRPSQIRGTSPKPNAEATPSSKVSMTPAHVVMDKPDARDSKALPTSVSHLSPQTIVASNKETPRTLDSSKQPVATKAADSIATPSQTKAPLDVNSKGAQSTQPVTNKTETQQPMNDQRWPDKVSTQNSNEPRSQADFSTSTPAIVSKQDSKKSTEKEGITTPHEQKASSGQGKESEPKVLLTPLSVSEKPQNMTTDRAGSPRMIDVQQNPGKPVKSIEPTSSPGNVPPTPVLVSEKPKTMTPDKAKTPQTIDVQKQPHTGSTVPNESGSSPTKQTVTPTVVKPQDRKGGSAKELNVSNYPISHSQGIIGATSEKSETSSARTPETLRTLNDLKVGEITKTDPNVSTSPAAATVNNSNGVSRPVLGTTSINLQPAAGNATPPKLNDIKIAESNKSTPNVPPSSPAPITSIPPVVNAQDSGMTKDNGPGDRRAVETGKAVESKLPPVSAGVPPQQVAANVAETQRTMEEQRAIITPKPTGSSGPGVTTQPAPVVVNPQGPRRNDTNRAPSANVPPQTIQSTEQATAVASIGSKTATGIPGPVPIRNSPSPIVTGRQCWICFATDEDEQGMSWIQPCKCKGTTKWVHQSCLQMWVDEKLREHKEKKVACPQCKTEYLIYLPKANILVRSLDKVDNVIYRVCPFVAAGVVIGSFYWNAVTYGAIVMLQVAGSEGAALVAETFQPTVIIVGLPFIPMSLIVFRLFQWEDSFLHILRTTSHCLPLLNYILPGHVVNETGVIADVPATTAMSFQRVLAGALLTPIIAKICGNLFFQSVKSPVWRTVCGGVLFISVKGLIKMYHKQQTYKRLSKRKILDYTDENKKLIEQSRPLIANQVVPTPNRFPFIETIVETR